MFEIWAGKLVFALLRLGRRGGTTLPGEVARRVSPFVLLRLAERVPMRVVVTGTNGKTTTCRLVAETCRRAGKTLVHNRSGANLLSGVTTAFLQAAKWDGRVEADLALLEVDEAMLARVQPEVRPQILAATNFFRDQLDRYGELDRTVAEVERAARGLGPEGIVLLNADDPLSVAMAERGLGRVAFFGSAVLGEETDPVLDVHRCPRCGGALRYRGRTIGHLGHFACLACGLRRPEPTVEVVAAQPQPEGQELQLRVRERRLSLTVPLPGLYNAYNVALAALLADSLGVLPFLPEAARQLRTSFGRMERVKVFGQEALLVLVKNPVGFNAALRAFGELAEAKSALFLINDRAADGHDVSWLWDVDFERLAADRHLRHCLTGGTRGPDMAVRLKYAGLGDRLVPGEGIEGPLAEFARAEGRRYIFVTYTALLEVRELLARRGEVKAFWEE